MVMYIYFLADVKTSLVMKKYIKESTNLFVEELSTMVFSPAKKSL